MGLAICLNRNCSVVFVRTHKVQFCSTACVEETTRNRDLMRSTEEWANINARLYVKGLTETMKADVSGKTEKFGAVELGEVKNPSKKEEKTSGKEKEVIKTKQEVSQASKQEKIIEGGQKNITLETGIDSIKKDNKIENKIENGKEVTKGNGMQKIEKKNLQKSEKEGEETIQPSDSQIYLTNLNEERLGSIQQLNTINEQLIGYAKSLAKPMTTGSDGEVIRRAPTGELELAIKCLTESRNIMKTKLDYMKFGRELLRD